MLDVIITFECELKSNLFIFILKFVNLINIAKTEVKFTIEVS